MEINADFTKRVAVHSANVAWVKSPMAGVDRRMLDRIADPMAAPLPTDKNQNQV